MYVVSQEERGEEREEREVRIRRRRRWSNNKNPILRIWGTRTPYLGYGGKQKYKYANNF